MGLSSDATEHSLASPVDGTRVTEWGRGPQPGAQALGGTAPLSQLPRSED